LASPTFSNFPVILAILLDKLAKTPVQTVATLDGTIKSATVLDTSCISDVSVFIMAAVECTVSSLTIVAGDSNCEC
jgi:hypothetical protein